MLLLFNFFFTGLIYCQEFIANGQMPSIIADGKNIHLVYGNGDSILYRSSTDGGKIFSNASVVSVLPDLVASHTRGPQISVTKENLLITACNNSGDIFSYVVDKKGKLIKQSRVNDVDTVAKENLMALSSDGDNAFAVWLDLRNGRNEIYGAGSRDGGRTWSANKRIYFSPDSSVCECCKPSVIVQGSGVYVMFRNWLNGNRDLYLISSGDGGKTFGKAQKIGQVSWKLKGCPMDGGALTVQNKVISTVWTREGKIYTSKAGGQEKQIGDGRSCTLTSFDGKIVYAWVENKQVVFLDTKGEKQVLGAGQLPVLTAINENAVICVWENNKTILKTLLKM